MVGGPRGIPAAGGGGGGWHKAGGGLPQHVNFKMIATSRLHGLSLCFPRSLYPNSHTPEQQGMAVLPQNTAAT